MEKLQTLSSFWDPSADLVETRELSRSLNRGHRNAVLKWLFESLDLLKIEDRVFFATVMLADKYCAKVKSRSFPLEGSDLQLVILSSLCCSLKTVECSLDLTIRAFLEHVSGGHVEPKDIFRTEAEILEVLDFSVISPSLSVFLESFYYVVTCSSSEERMPLEQSSKETPLPLWALKQYNLALFLLYLSVFDIDHFYSRSPHVIASSCILASAFALEDYPGSIAIGKTASVLQEAGWLSLNDNIRILIQDTISFWRRSISQPTDVVQALCGLFDSPHRQQASRTRIPTDRIQPSGG